MNKQKLEEDLVRAREELIFRAIELVDLRAEAFATGIPAPTDDAYERAKNAFDIAAFELADYLIREYDEASHYRNGFGLKDFKARDLDLLGESNAI